MIGGDAVLECVWAAGIGGDVAADGAGDLRRGVRCVIQSVGRGGLGDGEISHPWLHARRARHRIDGQDALRGAKLTDGLGVPNKNSVMVVVHYYFLRDVFRAKSASAVRYVFPCRTKEWTRAIPQACCEDPGR